MNQTQQEARDRVFQARLGSLVGQPSPAYLYRLMAELHLWLDTIEDALPRTGRGDVHEADGRD